MFVLITLGLLLAAAFGVVVLRLTRRSASFSWLAAALGALLVWFSVILWQLDLPQQFIPSVWAPVTLFDRAPNLLVDSYSWLYAFSLIALMVAVILTSPARMAVVTPAAWAGTLAIMIMALLAIMANNPLTLVLAWTAIDLVEFLNTIRSADSSSMSERAVISLSIRTAGTGFMLWASVVSVSSGGISSFDITPQGAGLYMLLGIGLRLDVLPLHFTYRSDPGLRRGFGSLLRLSAAATALVVLARIPVGVVDSRFVPVLLVFVLLAALYAGWKWLSMPDEINARPYWIIGMSALSIAAFLRGSPEGSAAWGSALILFGGLSFLYSSKQAWFTWILAIAGLALLSLPFTLTASGWAGAFPWPFLFWPLFLITHAFLVAGYVRHLFHTGEIPFAELPRWTQMSYPLGLTTLFFTILVTGLWGWPGSLQLGAWIVGLVMVALALLVGLIVLRLRRFATSDASVASTEREPSRFARIQDAFVWVIWTIYLELGRLMAYLANLLEGDGGLLWTLLLLVLFITLLRG
jgi:hypothetical protein